MSIPENRFAIRTLTTVAEIESFRSVWQSWPGHLYADIDFFLTTAEARKPAWQPHVTVVLENGTPRIMAAGFLTKSTLDLKLSHKKLFGVPMTILSVLRGGVLGEQSRENVEALTSALMQVLKRGEADALGIGHTPVESNFYKVLQGRVPFLCRDLAVRIDRHWKMKVAPTIEEVYAGLSGDHRKKLRWQNKNFEKHFPGAITVRCFTNADDQMIRDVEAISEKTYQRALGSSFIDNGVNRARLATESSQGWLRIYVLYIGDKPCAYWWGSFYRGVFFSEAMGYDQEYRRYSPGIYLMTKVLEDFCRNGIRELDFGAGDFLYKRQFGTEHWNETWVFYAFAARPKALLLNAARNLLAGCTAAAKRMLGLLHVVEPVRKLFRPEAPTTEGKSSAAPHAGGEPVVRQHT